MLDIPKYRANKKVRFNKLGLLHKNKILDGSNNLSI